MVHYDSGDLDGAIKIWQDVLDKEPTYPPALFYRALGLANQNNTAEALQHLDVLIKSAPADNLYFERGRELIRSIEQNNPAKIEQDEEAKERKLEKYSNDDDRTIN
jgi:tetratricopeptide (TPR) repeat protein